MGKKKPYKPKPKEGWGGLSQRYQYVSLGKRADGSFGYMTQQEYADRANPVQILCPVHVK